MIMSKPIHQEILISASPQNVYQALTDAKQFAEFTETAARIDPQSGGSFSCFDGMITGLTVEAIPGERLVQAWRVANWQAGVYSIVKFEFEKINDTETRLIFDHTGFPEEDRQHLEPGWHNKYWQPLKNYFNG